MLRTAPAAVWAHSTHSQVTGTHTSEQVKGLTPDWPNSEPRGRWSHHEEMRMYTRPEGRSSL